MQSLAASAEELTEAWAGTTPPELKSAWAKTLA
jgi:hypothetical protein